MAILQTSDHGYIVAGATFSNNGDVIGNHGSYDYWVVKLDANDNLLWQKALGGTGFDYANAIQKNPDGGYLLAGYSTSNDGDVSGNHAMKDAWLVKLAGVSSTYENTQPQDWQLFPNPAINFIQIEMAENRPGTIEVLSDLLGRQLLSKSFDQNCQLYVAGLPSGIYVVSVKTADGGLLQKTVIKQ